jgi:hypothetical protein
VGREEGRGNQNLPPSQIWRRRLGLEEGEERGQREKGKRKKRKLLLLLMFAILLTQKITNMYSLLDTKYHKNKADFCERKLLLFFGYMRNGRK